MSLSIQLALRNPKLRVLNPFFSPFLRRYSSSKSITGRSGKVVLGVISSAGLGFSATVVYSQYNPKLKIFLEDNIPYINYVYKIYPNDMQKSVFAKVESIREKIQHVNKEKSVTSGLQLEKLENEKSSNEGLSEPEPKPKFREPIQSKDDSNVEQFNVLKTDPSGDQVLKHTTRYENVASCQSALKETIENLRKKYEDAISAYNLAINAVKLHSKQLHKTLKSQDDDFLWKEAIEEHFKKEKNLELAKQKAEETRVLIENLIIHCKNLAHYDNDNPLIKNAEEIASKYEKELERVESEFKNAETDAKNAADYEQILKFREELEVKFPNYICSEEDNKFTVEDLNNLLAQAYRRIEKLQKEIAEQKVTEKRRLEKLLKNKKVQDDLLIASKIQSEVEKQRLDFDKAVKNHIAILKAKYEAELHQQLLRQTSVHMDHLKEALEQQKEELEKKYLLELEKELLNQKGVFATETSKNIARLMGVLDYLKVKSQLEESSNKVQHLWLACQALNYKITMDKSGNLCPLAKDIAALKFTSKDENSDFLNFVLESIPSEAVNRGVYINEALKERFQKVKHVCQQVALIDENKDSLYRYFLSYLQSLLVLESVSVTMEEHEREIAVDTSEWDTFDILSRISHSLQKDDLEQALRYANQLKGEPRIVAEDWMNEMRLSLETQLAVKALLAHAAAITVQAYH